MQKKKELCVYLYSDFYPSISLSQIIIIIFIQTQIQRGSGGIVVMAFNSSFIFKLILRLNVYYF